MNLKLIIMAIGFGVLLGTYIWFSLIFLDAYQSPDKAVLVTIDEFHEAKIECSLLFAFAPIIILTTYFSLKGAVNDRTK